MIEHEAQVAVNSSEQESAYFLISEIANSPEITQRQISSKLNISLGKTNYIIRELIKKGMVKAKNFSHNPGKLKKVKYMLTQKGFNEKMRLTYYFLKKKEAEFNRLKAEWEAINKTDYEV